MPDRGLPPSANRRLSRVWRSRATTYRLMSAFAASGEEQAAAAAIASSLLTHPRWQAARAASAAGRRVWREAPVVLRLSAVDSATHVMDGQVDLAYETDTGWVVVDFKTDIEIASAEAAYKNQIALYAQAVSKATGSPTTGVLLRV